jgi:hypothetical protein
MKNQLSLPKEFPNSSKEPFIITSPITRSYNCIAWAFGDTTKWYWPDEFLIGFWPKEISRECTLESFINLYKLIGYEVCDDESFEKDYDKIVIFTDKDNIPTHAAKQIDDTFWSSKLGEYHDVSHSKFSIEGGNYGSFNVIMKRKSKNSI